MRYEVFCKSKGGPDALATELTAAGARFRALGIMRINLPNKARGEDMLAQARAVRAGFGTGGRARQGSSQPPNVANRLSVCAHWSVKNQYERSEQATFARFCAFLDGAAAAGVDEVLLVSGGGQPRKLDAIGCLERLAKQRQPRRSSSSRGQRRPGGAQQNRVLL